jgi:oligopeptidase A
MSQFIQFDQLKLTDVQASLTQELAQSQQLIAKLEAATESSYVQIMLPLHEQLYKLNQVWGLVGHLQGVKDSPELRELHDKFLPAITDLYVGLGQNEKLYQHVVAIQQVEYPSLNPEQQKIIDNELRDFKLSGVSLAAEQKAQFKQIQTQLSELSTKFEHNVLDATDKFAYYATAAELAGVPSDILAMYQAQAQAEGKDDSYKITLHMPSYLPVMQYATNRELRATIYRAYVTRASELSDEGKFDNQQLIQQILQLRKQKAQLLGFSNYAQLSLATKMADTPSEVQEFLLDLAHKSRPYALNDLAELTEYASSVDGITELAAWDITYYSEKLQQHKYSYSSNELRQYFPLPKVFNGLFRLIQQLYQIDFVTNPQIPVWHRDVQGFDVVERGQVIGHIYFDLYARDGKQPGAWMNSAQDRNLSANETKLPIAYVICNFSKPLGDTPSLLYFDDVQTLFHEMGHALHHLLTAINSASIAGINGVEWDAVELPSQFMENFAWDYSILTMLSEHVETKAALSRELFERVLASRYYQSGLQMLRQLEFALFDLHLHNNFDPQQDNYLTAIEQVRKQVAVIFPPSYNRFPNSFGHIFAGGYAAGYYSYKWAEVLACDVFSIFDGKHGQELATLGEKLRQTVLSQGGLRPMMDNFTAFMGRKPQIDALLKYSGMR